MQIWRVLPANAPASQADFPQSFQADTHCTLYTHITARVLQKAKEKLACSDIPIGQLADVLGYSDEFYFSRVFKKHVGIVPSEYRRRCLSSH